MFDNQLHIVYTEPMKMTISTIDGTLDILPHETDDNLIIVTTPTRHVLELMVDSIELAGRADDLDFDDLAIYINTRSIIHKYELVLDRSTLALWFGFEIHHYLPKGA